MDRVRERRRLLADARAAPPRKVATACVRAHPGVLARDVHGLLDDLWDAGEPGRLLACELLRARPQLAVLLPVRTLERWSRDLADARLADAFAASALGAWAAARPDRVALLARFARSRRPWSRRAAASATRRLRHDPPAAALAVLDLLAADPAREVRGGVTLALRALAKRDAAAVRAWVQARRDVLPPALAREMERGTTPASSGRGRGRPSTPPP